jgi:hypothetical protein
MYTPKESAKMDEIKRKRISCVAPPSPYTEEGKKRWEAFNFVERPLKDIAFEWLAALAEWRRNKKRWAAAPDPVNTILVVVELREVVGMEDLTRFGNGFELLILWHRCNKSDFAFWLSLSRSGMDDLFEKFFNIRHEILWRILRVTYDGREQWMEQVKNSRLLLEVIEELYGMRW